MNTEAFLNEYAKSMSGKTLLITGASGGLGRELCRYLAPLGGKLILVNEFKDRAVQLKEELLHDFPEAEIECYCLDFENTEAVKELCRKLQSRTDINFLIHNAGAYFMPRRKSRAGVDNVFQINFLSPYYITKKLLPVLEKNHGKVIVTGSIAHSASKADRDDIDFSSRKIPSAVYGNSKRYLMYAHAELLRNNTDVRFSIAHPGISHTGITDNYPKLVKAVAKPSMKLLFMPPAKACLSILRAVFEDTPSGSWIGPDIAGIWGKPAIRALDGCSPDERKFIYETAEMLCNRMNGQTS